MDSVFETSDTESSFFDTNRSNESTTFVSFSEEMFESSTGLPILKKEAIQFKTHINNKTIEHQDESLRAKLTDIQLKINDVASSVLFRWVDVPIIFPKSLTGIDADLKLHTVPTNLFVLPTFDELDEISTDSDGKTKKLNKKQLESIQKTGKFDVDSKLFPGKKHTWVLARWLQKGYVNSNETFFSNISKAVHLIIITAKNRFFSDTFSVKSGVKSIKSGIVRLIDILFGMPHMCVVPFSDKLSEERQKYLIRNLRITADQQNIFEALCQKLESCLQENNKDNEKIQSDKCSFPYLYENENGLQIDIRLYNKKFFEKLKPRLTEILAIDENMKAELFKIRNEWILNLENQGLSEAHIVNKIQKVLMESYLEKVYLKLQSDKTLDSISSGVGQLLCDHYKAVLIMKEIEDKIEIKMQEDLSLYESQLKKTYPIRSLISDWIEKLVNEKKTTIMKQNEYKVYEQAVVQLKEHSLFQAAYFVERDMDFLRSHYDSMVADFERIQKPSKEFSFNRRIWFPKNYIVKSNIDSEYTISKSIPYKSSTQYPFWRWRNFFTRSWVNFCNSLFIFGGEVIKDRSSKTLTFTSRLCAIWTHVRSARRHFESTPDKGLLGKSVQRVFNRVWNYVFIGLFGSLGLTLVYPALCLLISTSSLIISLLSPIWSPVLSLLQHLAFVLVFDWDFPYSKSISERIFLLARILVLDLVVCGILQPVCAFLTAGVICPITSLIITIWAIFRKCFRTIWDNAFFNLLLKPLAKTPSCDTFIAKRISGPGLASNHFFQISIEQALAALEKFLEIKIIDEYLAACQAKLNIPINNFKQFFDPLFQPYSYELGSNHLYKNLQDEIRKLKNKYETEALLRKEFLNNSLNVSDLSKIRLSNKDLQLLLVKGEEIVKKNYIDTILKFKQIDERSFFKDNNLVNGWNELTGSILEELFSVGFLTPLEDTDDIFTLQVNHLNLAKYTEMIIDSDLLRDDMSSVNKIYTPRRNYLSIDLPSAECEMFNPNNEHNYDNRANYFLSTFNRVRCNEILKKDELRKFPKIPRNSAITAVIVHNAINYTKPIKFSNFEEIESCID